VLFLEAQAYPSGAGAPSIDRVQFTAWWPALGPESGPWKVISIYRTRNGSDRYERALIPADIGAPVGDIKISVDVRNPAGQARCATNGTHIVRFSP
jgi:hypothetical protein